MYGLMNIKKKIIIVKSPEYVENWKHNCYCVLMLFYWEVVLVLLYTYIHIYILYISIKWDCDVIDHILSFNRLYF